MKKPHTLFLSALAAIALVSGCAGGNNNDTLYQYPFKTAKIEYTISGLTDGKSTLTIKGDKSVRESHIVFHKKTGDEKQDNLYIDTGKYVYSVDLNKKTASMLVNPFYDLLIKMDPAARQDFLKKNAAGISPESVSTQELNTVGRTTIAGQPCEIYFTGGFAQICLWNNIALRTTIRISDLGLNTDTAATSVQTDINVPDSVFEVPAGMKVNKIGIEPGATTQQKS